MTEEPNLFNLPVFEPMTRNPDHRTSHESADVVRPHLGKIQAEVVKAIQAHGPMDARTMEELPEFRAYGHATIRKRVSELSKAGILTACGVDRSRRSPITIWRLT